MASPQFFSLQFRFFWFFLNPPQIGMANPFLSGEIYKKRIQKRLFSQVNRDAYIFRGDF